MAFPRLCVKTSEIFSNARSVVSLAQKWGIHVFGVTKGICALPEVGKAMLEAGCVALADSRLKNIRKMREAGLKGPFVLIRIPMPSEIDEMIDLADISLVSMTDTIELIERTCEAKGKTHRIVVMVDVGDLREGIWPTEVEQVVAVLKKTPRVRLVGVGTNVGCTGGVVPTAENMGLLVKVGSEFERALGTQLEIVSGGATSSLALLEEGNMPKGVNNLRIGEAILLGTDTNNNREIPYLSQKTLRLQAEVVEVRKKPSVPIGKIGVDAFGNVPKFEDRGIRRRAILAVGKQDIRLEGLTPEDPGVQILAASSDHLIVDVEDREDPPHIGDVFSFKLDYGAMLAAATSPYVQVVVDEQG